MTVGQPGPTAVETVGPSPSLRPWQRPVLIAGLPKTGTTALAAAVHCAVGGDAVFEPSCWSEVARIPDARVVKIVYPEHDSRPLASVMREFAAAPRKIWIYRDPRDQLVSVFLYTWFKAHNMPEAIYRVALDLVRRREEGQSIPFMQVLEQVFGPVTYFHNPDYYSGRVLRYFEGRRDESLLLYDYKDLVKKDFSRISDALGIEVSSAEVVGEHRRVARTQSSGNWRSWFTPADANLCRPLVGPYMRRMGIPDDWVTSTVPPDPYHGSWYMVWLRAGAEGPRPTTEEQAIALDQPGPDSTEPAG